MAYKPFKMKGHTLPGINQRSEGDTDTPEGRSGSSALQHRYVKGTGDPKLWTKAKERHNATFDTATGKHVPTKKMQEAASKAANEAASEAASETASRYIRRGGATGASEFMTEKLTKKSIKKARKRLNKKSPNKFAPLAAMAGKAILGTVASKVASKAMEKDKDK